MATKRNIAKVTNVVDVPPTLMASSSSSSSASVMTEERLNWVDLKNRALYVKGHSVNKKSFADKKSKLVKEIWLFEAITHNCGGGTVLMQGWGDIALELEKYMAKFDNPNAPSASSASSASSIPSEPAQVLVMIFDEEIDSKAVSHSNPKRLGFERIAPNKYQAENGIESVLSLKNSHLPFVSSAMPRPMKWKNDIYYLDGELLEPPQNWCQDVEVIHDADAADVDLGFIEFAEASPVKKMKPSV